MPVFNGAGDVIAVLDIDSDQADAFTREDSEALEVILASVFST